MALQVGQQVKIPCQVQPGPFSGELLVTFESIEGPISGFVLKEEVEGAGQRAQLRGVVRSISSDYLEVWIQGSFFTTNGLANVSRQMAAAA